MAYYNSIKETFKDPVRRSYIIDKLIKLKKQIDREVPDKDAENNLLLGTWNIRDFDKTFRRGFGKRTEDSFFYIAEIISAFDIIAIQEINELKEWQKVMQILGPDWAYIATDVADIRAGGNGERMTFVYDKRKVSFRNIAGEIVLPNRLLITKSGMTDSEEEKIVSGKQFRRTPFIVSFQSAWFKFELCTVHIYYGRGKSGLDQRIQEIGAIAKYLSTRVDKKLAEDFKSTILLGDFNIIRPDHETMKALMDNGFTVPRNIQKRKTNVINTMHYDQIAFKSDKKVIDYVEIDSDDPKKSNSGVFKVLNSVFQDTDDDFNFYKEAIEKSKNASVDAYLKNGGLRGYYRRNWRTYQMSDHNLLWVRLKTDDSINFLESIK